MCSSLYPPLILNSAASEIPEARLVRDLIYTFQGIEGSFIKFDRTSDSFRVVAEVFAREFIFRIPGGLHVLTFLMPSSVSRTQIANYVSALPNWDGCIGACAITSTGQWSAPDRLAWLSKYACHHSRRLSHVLQVIDLMLYLLRVFARLCKPSSQNTIGSLRASFLSFVWRTQTM